MAGGRGRARGRGRAGGRAPFRRRLVEGPPLAAVFSIIPAVEAVELVALAGFDAVVLDTEHGPYGVETMGPLVLAARARGIYAIARVRANDASLIGSTLDAGADAVLVPQVTSAPEAAAVVAATRFAPEGHRGANPYVRAADFMAEPAWFETENEKVAAICMIEGKEGIAALDPILATPGLDAVFVGPVDLSHALGVPGQTEHPSVVEQVAQVVRRAAEQDKATAVFAPTPDAANRWLAAGVRLVGVGVDTGWALHGLRQAFDQLRR